MKVLVTGAGGQVATSLMASPPQCVTLIGLTRSECDITDARRVVTVMRSVRPDVVINAAAFTAVDAAETERDAAFAVNKTGAANLARAAAKYRSRYVYVSTDYVFDGDLRTPYSVDAIPRPLNAYGTSKMLGEQEALASSDRACIVRTAWLYSQHGSNFLLTMLRVLGESSKASIVCDQVGSPTSANSLARFLWLVVQKDDVRGIYHWTDGGAASWYEFAMAIAEQAQLLGILPAGAKITPIKSADYVRAARRPQYSVLDTTRAQVELACRPRHWRDELYSVLSDIAR